MKDMHTLDFMEKHIEIHGEFNGTVYREKRNGELEKYPYDPVSYYERSALVIRGEWIRKYAAKVSNPMQADYSEIAKKLYYYTPYILPKGNQKLRGETGLFVREKGDYELFWDNAPMGITQKLGKRSEVKLSFVEEGEYLLKVFYEGELYCERSFIIDGGELDVLYDNWLAANYLEILGLAEPEYESIKTYRRGMRSRRNWIIALEGKCLDDVLYTRDDFRYKDKWWQRPWIYHRKSYDHAENSQTQYFIEKMKEIGNSWQQMSAEQRAQWEEKSEILWQKEGRRMHKPRISGFNLFTREEVKRNCENVKM